MKDKSIRNVFWAMVAFFVLTIGTIFIGNLPAENIVVTNFFLPFIAFFCILGIVLIVLTVRKMVTGKDRIFLLLAATAAVGLPVFILLHNLVTALFINLFSFRADFDEPVFFILAVIVCPLAFLVGAIGSLALMFKKKSRELVA